MLNVGILHIVMVFIQCIISRDKFTAFLKLHTVYLQHCNKRSFLKTFKIAFTSLSVMISLKNNY